MTDLQTERTFDVTATPAEAWKALEELRARASGPDEWWVPGFECRGAEVEAEPNRLLTVRKLEQPCADTLISVTFEHVDTGTRIHVVQSGFDKGFVDTAGERFWLHAEHLLADFQLFFERGVIAGRAWLPWAPLGVDIRTEPFGLRVTDVRDGTWAQRIGLQPDDVLLTVAGAPVYTAGELGVIERIVQSGEDVTATWDRAGERTEATAAV
jgi:hypothetical protein